MDENGAGASADDPAGGTPAGPAIEDEIVLDPTTYHRALAHPMRHRLLIVLGEAPATVSQLARTLDARKGSIAHHLTVLVEAGLVSAGETRHVRGGTEQYYARVARLIRSEGADLAASAALLSAVGTELEASTDPLLHLRYVRLTTAQADELRATLDRLVKELEEVPGGDRYGVLVSLYHPQRRPGGS
jgi:DNA-binding transcriptional ArsR family regulator